MIKHNILDITLTGLMAFDVLLPRPKALMITVKCSPTDCLGEIKVINTSSVCLR